MTDNAVVEDAPKSSKLFLWLALFFGALAILCYTQITFFVIHPIGAIPEGKTLVILRLNKTQFIDSADAMCERMNGGVSLICRMAALGAVAENATILARLPYSSGLYHISTGGAEYDR